MRPPELQHSTAYATAHFHPARSGWCHAEDSKRRTLQRSDIAAVVSRVEILDFLQDVVPPEEAAAGGGVKSEDGAHPGGSGGGGGVVGPSTSAAAAVHGPHAAHLAGASGAHFLPPGLNGLPFAPPGLPFAPGAGAPAASAASAAAVP